MKFRKSSQCGVTEIQTKMTQDIEFEQTTGFFGRTLVIFTWISVIFTWNSVILTWISVIFSRISAPGFHLNFSNFHLKLRSFSLESFLLDVYFEWISYIFKENFIFLSPQVNMTEILVKMIEIHSHITYSALAPRAK